MEEVRVELSCDMQAECLTEEPSGVVGNPYCCASQSGIPRNCATKAAYPSGRQAAQTQVSAAARGDALNG